MHHGRRVSFRPMALSVCAMSVAFILQMNKPGTLEEGSPAACPTTSYIPTVPTAPTPWETKAKGAVRLGIIWPLWASVSFSGQWPSSPSGCLCVCVEGHGVGCFSSSPNPRGPARGEGFPPNCYYIKSVNTVGLVPFYLPQQPARKSGLFSFREACVGPASQLQLPQPTSS